MLKIAFSRAGKHRFLRQKTIFSKPGNRIFSGRKQYFLPEKTILSPMSRISIHHLSTTTPQTRVNTGTTNSWWWICRQIQKNGSTGFSVS
jgi:hypothetical protein